MSVKYQHHDNKILSPKYACVYSEIDTLDFIGLHIDKSHVLATLIPFCRKINLIELIRGQTNLTTIEIIGEIIDHRKSLLSALCTQKNAITSMEFSYFPFEDFTNWTIFRQFTRLKRLKIHNVSKINIDDDVLGIKCIESTISQRTIHGKKYHGEALIPTRVNCHERTAGLDPLYFPQSATYFILMIKIMGNCKIKLHSPYSEEFSDDKEISSVADVNQELRQLKGQLKGQLKARKSINRQMDSRGGPGKAAVLLNMGDQMESFIMDLKFDGLYRT
ncbi:60_t:CDS:2 [Ambispora gerdemannii]|uniref:60_t:CDS:1 n=1 Tax=Ambispora gerdemannii TaxID=144530 RepID=A0A9N9CGU0_9GLOM|nr:60_t:CDS:2 [Ambispora gerdemannii]